VKLAQRHDGFPSIKMPALLRGFIWRVCRRAATPGDRRGRRSPTIPHQEGDAPVSFKTSVTASTKRIAVESAASTLSTETIDPGPVSSSAMALRCRHGLEMPVAQYPNLERMGL